MTDTEHATLKADFWERATNLWRFFNEMEAIHERYSGKGKAPMNCTITEAMNSREASRILAPAVLLGNQKRRKS